MHALGPRLGEETTTSRHHAATTVSTAVSNRRGAGATAACNSSPIRVETTSADADPAAVAVAVAATGVACEGEVALDKNAPLRYPRSTRASFFQNQFFVWFYIKYCYRNVVAKKFLQICVCPCCCWCVASWGKIKEEEGVGTGEHWPIVPWLVVKIHCLYLWHKYCVVDCCIGCFIDCGADNCSWNSWKIL
jgi:hypothetical protein